jgi:hypothetical protein
MKPLRKLVSLYDQRILGIFLPSKAATGICRDAIVWAIDWQVIFFIVKLFSPG